LYRNNQYDEAALLVAQNASFSPPTQIYILKSSQKSIEWKSSR